MKKEQKVFLDYLADYAAWLLGGAMFIYLGYRTLDFLMWTFREEDQVFAYLGLFSTTIGAVIFAIIWKRAFYFDRKAKVWRSDENRKTIALVMAIVCTLGEAGLAIADMTVITAQKGGAVSMTEGELKMFMWLTVGLAAAVGVSIAMIKLNPPHPMTDPEIDMSELDADNNGVLDSREMGKPMKQMALEERLAKLENENNELRQKAEAPKAEAGSQQPPRPKDS